MAGKVSAKGAVINLDDSAGTPRNISTDCVTYEIKQEAGKIMVQGMTEGSQNGIPGLPIYTVTLEIKWNSTATTGARTVCQGIFLSATSKTISITPEAGGQTFSGEFMMDALPVKGAVTGDIQLGTVTFTVMGSVAPAWA